MLIMKSRSLNDEELLKFACSLSSSTSQDISERVLHWNFGPILDMRFDPEAENYLFSAEKVPFHWDGAFHRTPNHLLFYCTESSGPGGETLFTDTEALWNSLPVDFQKVLSEISIQYSTEKKAHYGGTITIPLVQTHPLTRKTILRFAEKVETALNPIDVKILNCDNPDTIYNQLVQLIYDPRFCYSHQWSKGEVLVADNHRYLHGRLALSGNKLRAFKRIQIL